ncbi:extracellular calcium-sensing receptor-like [Protopterus annectens]|uniref:extracellular calcium-sensing receptor-like n=1 Tax=Protopterus annectens TaxID=7888 RepID=UPI001CFB41F2|nr:extracellular calcium-sensing receptor-like [Protopterus annectens]
MQQISYGSSVSLLSDKVQFPSFLRTFPSDQFLVYGLTRFALHVHWNWIGILSEGTDFGEIGGKLLKEDLFKNGICTAFFEIIPIVYSKEKIQYITKVIQLSSAKVIMAIAHESNIYPLIKEVANQNLPEKLWLTSDSLSLSATFSSNTFLKILNGSIMFVPRTAKMAGFQQFLYSLHPFTYPNDIHIKIFWEEVFGCKWPNTDSDNVTESRICTGSENLLKVNAQLLDISTSGQPYTVYNAIYAVAHGLKDLSLCITGKGPFENGTCANVNNFKPWQLLHYLRNVRFMNKAGEEIFFDVNGDPPAVYDLIAWYLNVPVSICTESCGLGHHKVLQNGQPPCCFDCIPCSQGEIANITGAHDCIKCPDDSWSNKGQDECIKKFIEFLSYQDFLGAILTTITSITALLPASVLIIFVKYRHTPIVKANNRELSYILLIALVLCSLCSLIFIGKPTVLMCMLRQTVFGIMFALCVSCVLAKTITVVIAFKATNPNSKLRKWMGPVLPGCIICFCTIVQITLCVVWLSTTPPFPEKNMKFKLDTIIIECNDGSSNALWWLLGYMGLLASISLVVAFLARTLPDSFNEAKFITFSMLVFVSVWLSFIPAYLSTRGKYMVAVEIFAILSSSSGLIICIFIPKCYIILVRSEMNTREYLIRKETFIGKM